MSLVSFVGLPDVRAKLKPFRPKPPRKIPAQLRVEPGSDDYSTMGTAFDYLLRFELQRRAPHAVSRRWVAEDALDMISKADAGGGIFLLGKDSDGFVRLATDPAEVMGDEELTKEVAERISSVVKRARSAVAAFVKNKSPALSEQADLAGHAIRLAKLDVLYRAQALHPSFEAAAQEDVEDMLGMLAIVPFESLLHAKRLLLNPSFGETSDLVEGADCDLISGDLLVDLKTTKLRVMQAKDLDQLFGYFLLARHQRCADPNFPEIKRVAFYFCRHGHLWVLDVTAWTQRPEFLEVEQWFLKRAKEVLSEPMLPPSEPESIPREEAAKPGPWRLALGKVSEPVDDTDEKVVAQLKARRESLGLTLAEVAGRMGIEVSALSQLETGKAPRLRIGRLMKWMKALEEKPEG